MKTTPLGWLVIRRASAASPEWRHAAPSPKAKNARVRVGGGRLKSTLSHYRCWFPTIHHFKSGRNHGDDANGSGPDRLRGRALGLLHLPGRGCATSRTGALPWERKPAARRPAWSEAPDEQDRIWWWGNYPEPVRQGDDRNFTVPLTMYSRGGQSFCTDRSVIMKAQRAIYPVPIWLFDYLFDRKNPVLDSRQKIQYSLRAWGNIIRGPQGELLSDGYLTAAEDVQRKGAESTLQDTVPSQRALPLPR